MRGKIHFASREVASCTAADDSLTRIGGVAGRSPCIGTDPATRSHFQRRAAIMYPSQLRYSARCWWSFRFDFNTADLLLALVYSDSGHERCCDCCLLLGDCSGGRSLPPHHPIRRPSISYPAPV